MGLKKRCEVFGITPDTTEAETVDKFIHNCRTTVTEYYMFVGLTEAVDPDKGPDVGKNTINTQLRAVDQIKLVKDDIDASLWSLCQCVVSGKKLPQ